MGKKRNQELIQEIKKFKEQLAKKTKVNKMILFGSRVSGKVHKWSDVDILLVSDNFRKKPMYKRSRGFYILWHRYLNYPVDFICYSPEEFEREKKRITIVKQAVEEGIEI